MVVVVAGLVGLVALAPSTEPARALDQLPADRLGLESIDGGADVLTAASRTKFIETRVIGHSVQGRDIVATRMGTPGGRVALVVGVIHGDETGGRRITQELLTMAVPADVDLWVIDSVNPDGEALGTRQNANHVDLNRNFEINWRPIAASGTGESAGRAAADQPETAAVEAFIREIQPQVSIWWHQAANRVSPGGARPEIADAYAQLVGQRVAGTPCISGCTGTETQFTNTVVPGGTAFIDELPPDAALTPAVVRQHAAAVMTVIAM